MADRICLGCMEKIKDIYDVCPYCGYVDGTPAKEAYHLTPGTVINGKYIVGQVIGYGGFGVTYIGYDGLLEKKIAIKEYLPSEFGTRMPGQTEVTIYSGEREEQFYSGIEKFVDEARRLAQFTDVPGIVHIFDSFMENRTAYIVMEYLEGETLKEHLAKEGKIGVEEALSIMIPILDALQEVHKIEIIHRDIAPDNIFLTRDGKVKLLDFGAARYATTTHSKSLSVIIKQGYAPEEQYRSRGDQGPWTDVYACGATLYKMLTGITPEDSMERVGKDTLVPPSKKGAKTSKNLDTAIMNAMNLAIEDRTQSAKEFEDELMSEAEVKRKKQHDRKVDIGRWPLWVKITSGAVAALVLVFVGLLLTGVIHFDMGAIVDRGTLAAGTVYVPNLVNYAVDEAEVKTIEHELILQVMDKQNSEVIPRDKILSQNVQDGYVVEVGSTIEVAVSAGGEIVYLPELEGLSEEEARKALEDLGLRVESVEEPSEVAPGCVIRYDALRVDEDTQETQVVDSTNGVEKNKTIIKLYISSGIDDIDETKDTTVPKLIGMDYNTASQTAGASKLYIYRSGSEYSSTVPKGQIMRQDVAEGTKVKEGTRIGVVISLGEQMARVPDVQYKDVNEAINLLTSNNLTYDVQYEDSDTVAKDHVIRQSVAAGTEVAMQTKVTIYISKGNPNANKQAVIVAENTTAASTQSTTEATTAVTTAESSKSRADSESTTETLATTESTSTEEEKATVPNVVGMTETAAKSELSSAGLQVAVTYEADDSKTKDTVQSQSVNAGTKVSKNTTVSLVVAIEEGKIEVPNLVGMAETEAKTAITNAKLKVGTVSYYSQSSSSSGSVLGQGVNAGSKVKKNTEIPIYVCNNSTHTEYRYSSVTGYEQPYTKTTTNSSPGADYVFDHSEVETTYGDYTGNWSAWSTTAVTATDTRKVETRSVNATYKTQYFYDRWVNSSHTLVMPAKSGYCVNHEETGWLDSPLAPDTVDSWWGYTYQSYGKGYGQGSNICWYNQQTRQVEVTPAYTEYRYEDKPVINTTYYYWKKPIWGSWSDWSTTKQTTSDTKKEETRSAPDYTPY